MSSPASSTDAPSCTWVMRQALESKRRRSLVYSVDVRSILGQPFARETFSRREDAEAFLEEVRRDNPELARDLRIEERELVAHPDPHSRIRPAREIRTAA
jgi:hypothetical protein